jgi:hypothetical protein
VMDVSPNFEGDPAKNTPMLEILIKRQLLGCPINGRTFPTANNDQLCRRKLDDL